MVDSAGVVSEGRVRRWRSVAEKRRIVELTQEPGASVALVARANGVNANQVFKWRRLHVVGRLGPRAARDIQLLPVRVAEEQEASRPEEPGGTPVARSTSMHIELPGSARIRLEGNVDAAMVRAVLKSLRS